MEVEERTSDVLDAVRVAQELLQLILIAALIVKLTKSDGWVEPWMFSMIRSNEAPRR